MNGSRFLSLPLSAAPLRWPMRFAPAPAVAAPAVAQPGIVGPRVIKPRVTRPRFGRPPVARPHVARPDVARPGTRTERRPEVEARTGTGTGTGGIVCLGLSISLETSQTDRLADIILDRVLGCPGPVGTVILDLRPGAGIDADSRTALVSLHHRLRSAGTRLRITTSCRQLAPRLGEADLRQYLGPDAIHGSFRAAVLATYAALPGPGLVTAQIRAVLDTPVEAVGC